MLHPHSVLPTTAISLVSPVTALVTAFTCDSNESCRSKVTPRSLGVGLKGIGSPAMVREGECDASFVHVEKKATSLLLAFSPSFARMTSGELPLLVALLCRVAAKSFRTVRSLALAQSNRSVPRLSFGCMKS